MFNYNLKKYFSSNSAYNYDFFNWAKQQKHWRVIYLVIYIKIGQYLLLNILFLITVRFVKEP